MAGWIGSVDVETARRMRDLLAHRGPDDFGEWLSEDSSAWLGQRRLSILDLSPEGRQPMASPSGRWILTYNGEIYNYRDVARELEGIGYTFRGHSDTEILVDAIEAWGVEAALERIAGMFAFGAYDTHEKRLWLARDRIGIKPLYWTASGGQIAFASEMRALKPLQWMSREIDLDALHSYFRFLCVPAPATILKDCRKLLPGEILCWDGREARTWRYWDVKSAALKGLADQLDCTFSEAADEFERMMREIVDAHLVSDVPLGAFLSGGVDSSLVVAMMQQVCSTPAKTFSIGFSEASHDESRYSKKIAEHLETDHQEHILTPSETMALIPRVASMHDEPFADSSSVPTFLVSKFAREHVTVALSGDGGDELFGGYPRYFWAGRIQKAHRAPKWGRRAIGAAISAIPKSVWDGPVSRFGGRRLAGSEGLSQRVRRFGKYLNCEPEDVFDEIIAAWSDTEALLGASVMNRIGPDPRKFSEMQWACQMMAVDQENFLVDDVLTKVDRTSMAVALEVRVPILDHRIIEWSWRVPLEYKLANAGDRGKLLMREVLYRHVPRALIERPKQGFGMPVGQWLREELRDWVESIIAPSGFDDSSGLNADLVRAAWQEHLAGQDRLSRIWTVLMYMQWRGEWLS